MATISSKRQTHIEGKTLSNGLPRSFQLEVNKLGEIPYIDEFKRYPGKPVGTNSADLKEQLLKHFGLPGTYTPKVSTRVAGNNGNMYVVSKEWAK